MMRSAKQLLSMLAVVGLVAGSASATELDFGPWGANISSVGGASGSDIYAQRFIAPAENVLIEAGMYLNGGGNVPPEIRLDVWGADGAGWPDENNVVVLGPVHQGPYAELTLVTLVTNTKLVPGETYWVVLNGMIDQTSDGSYSSTWSYPDDPYPDGYATWSNDMANSCRAIAP